ncbi:hypothetical protein NE237_000879 [Protea cynaroides]|uniref:Uncharacterized protein n=1 Tax=Protea cynaroides TaxID=273540 RepID=A0A9Q0KS41_9MAGN|nr:hypothetical protein NE237_000879 [Protea cynaroides]
MMVTSPSEEEEDDQGEEDEEEDDQGEEDEEEDDQEEEEEGGSSSDTEEGGSSSDTEEEEEETDDEESHSDDTEEEEEISSDSTTEEDTASTSSDNTEEEVLSDEISSDSTEEIEEDIEEMEEKEKKLRYGPILPQPNFFISDDESDDPLVPQPEIIYYRKRAAGPALPEPTGVSFEYDLLEMKPKEVENRTHSLLQMRSSHPLINNAILLNPSTSRRTERDLEKEDADEHVDACNDFDFLSSSPPPTEEEEIFAFFEKPAVNRIKKAGKIINFLYCGTELFLSWGFFGEMGTTVRMGFKPEDLKVASPQSFNSSHVPLHYPLLTLNFQ